ncbi:PKD domain-containing protein [Chryseobacterium aahli]|uniref:PKD domain-containing protein n=1 Tax=Chryseobacterium aahli TaxID=1278643 RepID=UPI001F6182ED|nr:PKD domain-containing protein [Chryseobacterium aahli]MCI3938800.1 PKD domain-containing protein [Chryseobacterium aahli]
MLVSAQSPLSKFTTAISGANTVNFTNTSTGSPTSFAWEFTGGTPSTSTSPNPNVTYTAAGVYTAKLTVSNASGSSISTRTVKVTTGNIIDLSSGKNNDGTLMPDVDASDTDWTYTDPNGIVSTPVTRYAATAAGWSSASTGGIAGASRWITGNNVINGYHYYVNKEFEIPQGSTAVLNLRSLSFVRNWTFLVKKNDDGTLTETQITATTWMSDGAKGWLNSRSPEVVNYPLTPGKYYIKVQLYTNNTGQRQAIDVNANVNFGYGFTFSPIADFSANPTSTNVGSSVQFTNLSGGTPSSVSWNFEDGANILTSTQNNPSIAFSTVGSHYAELLADYSSGLLSSLKINNYIQTTQLDAPIVAVTQPTCNLSTGSITVTSPITGVTYSFDNGVTFQSTNSVSGLISGTYLVRVKNMQGAVSDATSVTINPGLAVLNTPVLTIVQPACPVNTGSITITSPATGVEYSFDGGVTYQASNIKVGLAAGTYTIMVKNTNGCTSSASAVINSVDCREWTLAPNSYIFTGKDQNNYEVDGIYIPVKKAFVMWKNNSKLNNQTLSGIMTATVYWQDVPGLIKSTGANYSLVLSDANNNEETKIQVPIDKSKGYGNAVVALHMGSNGNTTDPIVWSWHVWVTDDPSNGPSFGHSAGRGLEFINGDSVNNYYNATTSKIFTPKYMDRNMGATDTGFVLKNGVYTPSLKGNKSGGLMYQWGRKDPMPPLVYKDGTFYDVIGEVGVVRSKDASYKQNKTSPTSLKIFEYANGTGYFIPTVAGVKNNISQSVNNPLKPIYNGSSSIKTWFAGNSYDNLWSDNSKGEYDPNGDLYSRVKGYLPKSSFDPCPNKWRIPSVLSSRTVLPINFYPFGQNITATGSTIPTAGVIKAINFKPKGLSTLNGGNDKIYNGIKAYPHIGFDLSNIGNPNDGGSSNMGFMVGTGRYGVRGTVGFIPYFSDTHQIFLWTATIGNDSGSTGNMNFMPNQMVFTPDPGNPARPDAANYSNMIGNYSINFTTSEVNETQAMNACRCMQDPYADNTINPSTSSSFDFPTEYLPISPSTPGIYSNGLSNPNSYVLVKSTSEQIVKTEISPNNFVDGIPINKAFAVYNNYLSDHQLPAFDNLKVNVYWTTDPGLITNIKLNQLPSSIADLDNTVINVKVAAGKSGNAIVSLHNGSISNPVLWSWHIWVSNTDPTANAITYKTEKDDILETDGILHGDVINYVGFTNSGEKSQTNIFMDRNLGAIDVLPTPTPDGNGNYFPSSSELALVKNSGGLQYQWGRKDPIPTFVSPGYNIGNINVSPGVAQNVYISSLGPDAQGNLSASSFNTTPVTGNSYKSTYAKLYNDASAGITTYDSPSDTKQTKIRNHLRKSIEKPFTFFHQNIKNAGVFQDWLLDEPNAMPNRWGHADSKSPFDPCPCGWRVPDSGVPNARYDGNGIKGDSPWYFGGYNTGSESIYKYYSYGIFESNKQSIKQNGGPYPGVAIKDAIPINGNYIRYGISFGVPSEDFKIGNIPYTGIRGAFEKDLGNFALAYGYAGLWTSSLNETYLGGANALFMNRTLQLQTKVANDPYTAMNVRCVKIDPTASTVIAKQHSPNTELLREVARPTVESEEKLFPIPFKDELHITANKEISYLLYDMRGALIGSGKFINKKVNLSHLLQGVYIIKLIDISENKTTTKKIIKN